MTPTVDAATLDRLLERVKAATGPDRELAHDIWRALCWEHHWREVSADSPITASVDAAIALVESVLPPGEHWAKGSPPSSGWRINLYRGLTPTNAPYASWEATIRRHAENGQTYIAPTAPLAILAALLTALKDHPNG